MTTLYVTAAMKRVIEEMKAGAELVYSPSTFRRAQVTVGTKDGERKIQIKTFDALRPLIEIVPDETRVHSWDVRTYRLKK